MITGAWRKNRSGDVQGKLSMHRAAQREAGGGGEVEGGYIVNPPLQPANPC